MAIYNLLGWYIALRVYDYRTKKYIKENKQNIYSLKKEVILFLFIWPIAPIILHIILLLISVIFPDSFFIECMVLTMGWFFYGWIIALVIYYQRRKNYFKEHIEEKKSKKGLARFIPLLIVLTILGLIAFYVIRMISDFKDDGYRDFSPKGTKIRLAISKEECQKYPNRYYFNDLCILCPDEQPLIDGHCQRCPKGQFVISNGCRDCDSYINYKTPKAECDACPNRIYEDGLCKPIHHISSPRGCDDPAPWYNASKEDCDACPNRKYNQFSNTSRGNCELKKHGWQKASISGKFIADYAFYDENSDLTIIREFYNNGHLKSERYIKEKRYLTYFKNGQLRTEEQENRLLKGYYANGVLAFETKENEAYFYSKNGEQIAYGIIAEKTDYFIELYILENSQKKSVSKDVFFNFLKSNYDIDFRLPFGFVHQKGKTKYYNYYGDKAEENFQNS